MGSNFARIGPMKSCCCAYWLGALLLAFESHQKGPLGRAAGLPVVLGFPETDNRITDLQVNVPPAAMVAFLAGRAYQLPTCPATKYVVDPQGLSPRTNIAGGLAGLGGGCQAHESGNCQVSTATWR